MNKYTPEKRIAKFWSRVDRSGGDDACWEWQGHKFDGYGRVTWYGRESRAHRIAWLLTNGDPGELYVLHECDNRACCNPAHLFLGTQLDNMRDCADKGRLARGDRSGTTKLSDVIIKEIRARYAIGDISQAQIARDYCVSKMQISRIIRGKSR